MLYLGRRSLRKCTLFLSGGTARESSCHREASLIWTFSVTRGAGVGRQRPFHRETPGIVVEVSEEQVTRAVVGGDHAPRAPGSPPGWQMPGAALQRAQSWAVHGAPAHRAGAAGLHWP